MMIAEVSEKYGISADTLRYYERIGLLPPVNRKKSGVRDYTQEDCNWVQFVKCFRGAGVQVEALIDYIALYREGDHTYEARKQILLEQREQLLDRMEQMQDTLKQLNHKIEVYSK